MSACGRKRTLNLLCFRSSERPVSGKADIRLESRKRSANDPKRSIAI